MAIGVLLDLSSNGNTGYINLAEICLDYYDESEGTQLDLAWAILLIENDYELDYIYSNSNEWRKIISEEIRIKGLSPNWNLDLKCFLAIA